MASGNWQTWAVYIVVAATLGVFAWKLVRGFRTGKGCGESCGCAGEPGFKRHEVIEKIIRERR